MSTTLCASAHILVSAYKELFITEVVGLTKRTCMTIHLCSKEELEVSRIFRKISLKKTSICILRCILKLDRRAKKMARDSSKTSGMELTPFFDKATHKYCFMAVMNISLDLNTGPAFCRIDRRR